MIITTPQAFKKAIAGSKYEGMLSNYTETELSKLVLYKDLEQNVGFALNIKEDSIDIVNVFNNTGTKGLGRIALDTAIKICLKTTDNITLDHFEGFLSNYYESFGFKEVGREKYDVKYDEGGAFAEVYGEIDVVYRKLEGNK